MGEQFWCLHFHAQWRTVGILVGPHGGGSVCRAREERMDRSSQAVTESKQRHGHPIPRYGTLGQGVLVSSGGVLGDSVCRFRCRFAVASCVASYIRTAPCHFDIPGYGKIKKTASKEMRGRFAEVCERFTFATSRQLIKGSESVIYLCYCTKSRVGLRTTLCL